MVLFFFSFFSFFSSFSLLFLFTNYTTHIYRPTGLPRDTHAQGIPRHPFLTIPMPITAGDYPTTQLWMQCLAAVAELQIDSDFRITRFHEKNFLIIGKIEILKRWLSLFQNDHALTKVCLFVVKIFVLISTIKYIDTPQSYIYSLLFMGYSIFLLFLITKHFFNNLFLGLDHEIYFIYMSILHIFTVSWNTLFFFLLLFCTQTQFKCS